MRRWFENEEVYRHRSYDYRRKKFPVWLIIIVIIILIAIVYAYDIGGLKTSTNKILNNINLSSSSSYSNSFRLNTKNCPSDIIPDKITIIEYPVRDFIGSWKDGTPINEYKSPDDYSIDILTIFNKQCHQGNNQGENINYFYCNNLFYSKNIQKINSNGDIISKYDNNYTINIILEPDTGNFTIFKYSFPLTNDMFTQAELSDEPSIDLILKVAERNNIYPLSSIDWNFKLSSYANTNMTTKFDKITWQYRNPFTGMSWVLINGKVWLTSNNERGYLERGIYRNYTILNANCMKK